MDRFLMGLVATGWPEQDWHAEKMAKANLESLFSQIAIMMIYGVSAGFSSLNIVHATRLQRKVSGGILAPQVREWLGNRMHSDCELHSRMGFSRISRQ